MKIEEIGKTYCNVCFDEKHYSIGHSFTFTAIYDIQKCKCGTKVIKAKPLK